MLVDLMNSHRYLERCHILFLVLNFVLYCFLTVMAAELVNAARNEGGINLEINYRRVV